MKDDAGGTGSQVVRKRINADDIILNPSVCIHKYINSADALRRCGANLDAD